MKVEGSDVRTSYVCCHQTTKTHDLTVGMWTIDPIDGTKGFLRGEQYAVCLSLIVDSIVQVGVIGCPNLPVNTQSSSEQGTGCIFVAVRGQGARQVRVASPLPFLRLFCHRFIEWSYTHSWLLTAPILPY